MHKKNLVSIIVPIFNMEKYLDRCLESIKKQTYTNYEVLLVNDGSTDSSESICKKYLDDERFFYFFQNNSGVSAARNKGMEMSHGEWIAFIDPDDYLDDVYLEKLLSYLERNLEVDIVTCAFSSVRRGKKVKYELFEDIDEYCFFSDEIKCEKYCNYEKKHLLIQLMNRNYGGKKPSAIGVPWGKLYKKTFLLTYNLKFDSELKRMQDNIFNMYAFEEAKAILYVGDSLYNYNMDHLITMGNKYDIESKDYITKLCMKRYRYLSEKELLENELFASLYCEEAIGLFGIIMRMKIANKNNRDSFIVRKKEIEEILNYNCFSWAFDNKKRYSISVICGMRAYLVNNKLFRELLIFERVINTIRIVKIKLTGCV